ncbi:MAG: LacI family DNA-binding transcriptional regulator, partial [bacterium]
MSTSVSIKEVARVAEVSVAAVSYTLNGKGDRYRIGGDTQARIRAVARQLDYQPDTLAKEIRTGSQRTAVSGSIATVTRREIGIVVGAGSPASTLALIPEQEPILAAAGYTTIFVALPADAEAIRLRLASLLATGVQGILSCPSVFATVAAAMADQCPVIALSPWAAETLLHPKPAPALQQSASIPKPTPASKPFPVTAIPVTAPLPVAKPIAVPLPEPIAVPVPEVIHEPGPVKVATEPVPEPVALPVPAAVMAPEPISEPEPEPPLVTPETAPPAEPLPQPGPSQEPDPVPASIPDTEPTQEVPPVTLEESSPEPIPEPAPEPPPVIPEAEKPE